MNVCVGDRGTYFFGADPVGIRVAYFPLLSSETVDGFCPNLHRYNLLGGGTS